MANRKKKISQGNTVWLTLLGLAGLGVLIKVLLKNKDIAIFNPKGLIANEQFNLIVFSVALMMIIAVPTLFLFYFFAWKYRETNVKAANDTKLSHGKMFNFILWSIPSVFVVILAVIMWPATHRLEPQKNITANIKPLRIQVVAMRWKWLFLYPEQQIATVNFIQIPTDTPVEFDITADDTPMSSFWIPHWGGQLYAMTGHLNRLNLIADSTGDYPGSSAEINGRGFAGMKFIARASTEENFNNWVDEVRKSQNVLDIATYEALLRPSENSPVVHYSSYDAILYDNLLLKYSGHDSAHSQQNEEEAHN